MSHRINDKSSGTDDRFVSSVNLPEARQTTKSDGLSHQAMRVFVALFLTPFASAAEPPKVTFLRDVAPILNKVGCTSGPCHGAAKGKNGFKLSLRGYDPQFDYESLLYDLSGRRFNRADPGRSLMLAKPTQEVAHGGGLRFDIGSDYYKTIYNWIAQGVPFGDPAADTVRRLEVEPKEIFMNAPGESARVKVTAIYGDGNSRDITGLAVVESNVPDVATVADATVKGARTGEATMLLRYQGTLATMPVTVLNPKPGFAWKPLPQNNYIDRAIDAKLQRLKIQPSSVVDDAGFLRRVSLDLTGQLPTPAEARAFTADASKTKRSTLIDKLIASSAFVDHWTLKWGDLLQNSRKYLGEKGAFEFREWIRESIAQNKPYDRMVREMLTARGSTYENPAANFYRVTRDPKPTMEKTTQVFLGVRMVCAQCHDHPFERWTQNQYYEMAAFFSAVGLRPGYEVGEEILYDQRQDFDMKHPKDGRVMNPKFILPASYSGGGSRTNRHAPPSDLRRMAYRQGQSLLREIHRQSRVELLLRSRHHRPRGRHPRIQSAQQPGAARRADQGFPGSRVRPAPVDAHHRQLARLPVQYRHQRVESERHRQFLARHSPPHQRGGPDGRARPRHRRSSGLPRSAPGDARRAGHRSAHRQGRLPRSLRPALARIVVRVRTPQRSQPAAGVEPGERPNYLRRSRRFQRTRRQGGPKR